MPIRINLKEVFPADSQEITVDKINFNFNKLLELGIGEQGKRGFSGIQGAAGPEGIIGPTGIRGATWFVDAGNPTLIDDPNNPDDLLTGDLYLDSTQLAVWQWNGSTWDFIFNITTIINNYLAATPSPFSRGLGIGTPKDDRFIVFNQRSDNNSDTSLGGLTPNTANNDILFLNNFNEDVLEAALNPFAYGPAFTPSGQQTATMDYFNSLLSIYVDHTILPIGRNHLELGLLYEDIGSPGDARLTTVSENLKVKLLRENSLLSSHYNKAAISLDIPDTAPILLRDFNSVFEFNLPKFSTSQSQNQRTQFYLGSRYGLDEIFGVADLIKTDGALFTLQSPSTFANIGIAAGFNVAALPDTTGYFINPTIGRNYFMLGGSDSINSIYLAKEVIQDGGNIVQLGTSSPREKSSIAAESLNSPYDWNTFVGHMGIASDGEYVYTVSGEFNIGFNANALQNKNGYFNSFSITDPNEPIAIRSVKTNGRTSGGVVVAPDCTSFSYSGSTSPIGPGMSDIDVVGDLAYIVNTQVANNIVNSIAAPPSESFARTYFQIFRLNRGTFDEHPTRISRLGYGSKKGSTSPDDLPNFEDPLELNGAYRVKVKGRHAIVATNALYEGASPTFLGNGQLVTPGAEYSGRITAVDVSDPTDPQISASHVHQLLSIPGSTSAMLDLEVVGDTAFALVWEQTIPGLLDPPVTNISIRAHAYDLTGLADLDTPTIGNRGRADSQMFTASGVDSTAYAQIFKRGAIVSDGSKLYAGWKDTIKIYSLDSPTVAGSIGKGGGGCYLEYSEEQVITLSGIPVGAQAGIVDMKVLGNSLWVLATVDNNSFVYKFTISKSTVDPANLVFSREVFAPATRFIVIGKHIYLASHNASNNEVGSPAFITLDFDGIYTSGAHIESLRSDSIEVAQRLAVSKNLTVHGDSNFGADVEVSGRLSSSEIQTDRLYSNDGIKLLGDIESAQGPWRINLDAATAADRLTWLDPATTGALADSAVNHATSIGANFVSDLSTLALANLSNAPFFGAVNYDRLVWLTVEDPLALPGATGDSVSFEIWLTRGSTSPRYRTLLTLFQRWNSSQQFHVPAGYRWAARIQRTSGSPATNCEWDVYYREIIFGRNI